MQNFSVNTARSKRRSGSAWGCRKRRNDDEAKKRLDALLDVLKDKKETMEAADIAGRRPRSRAAVAQISGEPVPGGRRHKHPKSLVGTLGKVDQSPQFKFKKETDIQQECRRSSSAAKFANPGPPRGNHGRFGKRRPGFGLVLAAGPGTPMPRARRTWAAAGVGALHPAKNLATLVTSSSPLTKA